MCRSCRDACSSSCARDLAVAEGYLVVDAESVVATHLNQLLAARAHELLGPDQVRELLESVRERHAQLVETITPQPLSLAAITRLLRALLADGITLAHPLPVLASLSQAAQQTTDHERLVDMLRADLGPLLVGNLCAPDERLPVITLAAELEEMVVGGLHDPASGQIVIEPDLARSIGWAAGNSLMDRTAQPIEVIAIVGGDDALPQPTGPAEALEHQREPLAA